ncbi:Disease resistance protein L6 [Linum grandiflorum]
MTSSEISLSPLPTGQHEVFLTFRGPENYASSKRYLQELAKMVDCWKSGGGAKGEHIILPVFYLIDPKDVRHLDYGPYKEVFEQHSLNHDPETVLEWKEALQEVGKMKGWHVTQSDGHGAIIDKIVIEVEFHLRTNYTLVTDELVGIDFRVEEVVRLLNLDSASEKIVDEKFQFDEVLGKLNHFLMDSRFLITTRNARGLELLQGYFTEILPLSLEGLLISNVTPETSCKDLQRLPNLTNLTNLSMLVLKGIRIAEILGLGELKILDALVIEQAANIVNLDGLENLVLPKRLRVEGCLVLEKLPSLVALTRLELLEIIDCPVLAEVNVEGQLWESLSVINVCGCSRCTGLETLHSMEKLQFLALIGKLTTETVPSSLSMFTKLTNLFLSGMSRTQFPDISNLKNLRELFMDSCQELIEVTGLSTLESLELLSMEGCRSISKLPDLSSLLKLKAIDVRGCTQSTEVQGLGRLESLATLYMSGCESIKELPDLSGLKQLRELDLKKCRQLKEVNGLEGLELIVFEADAWIKVKYFLKSVAKAREATTN